MFTSYLLIGLGMICIIVELALGVATGFDLFLIGLSLVIGGAVGYFTGSATFAYLTSVALFIVYITFGRTLIKSKLKIHTTPTNSDALIGQNGRVVKHISVGHPGQVKVDGEIWRAQADAELEIGRAIVVQSVSGVTLTVK
jgi:membrane protein implicated in regulation of membrane protease activity